MVSGFALLKVDDCCQTSNKFSLDVAARPGPADCVGNPKQWFFVAVLASLGWTFHVAGRDVGRHPLALA